MDDMLSLTATTMGAQDVVLGACVDASGDGYLASLKPVCKTSLTGTFLATEMYTGTDSCDEAMLSSGSSLSGECTQDEDEQGSPTGTWTSLECVASTPAPTPVPEPTPEASTPAPTPVPEPTPETTTSLSIEDLDSGSLHGAGGLAAAWLLVGVVVFM